MAEDVRVDKYRYVDVLHTNKGDILQTSSEISGRLPEDYPHHLGEILDAQLPAGSITGAPKDKTMQIIQEAEGYDRGFYTGIMGIYDQGELNSAVMIRFIEEEETSPVDLKPTEKRISRQTKERSRRKAENCISRQAAASLRRAIAGGNTRK